MAQPQGGAGASPTPGAGPIPPPGSGSQSKQNEGIVDAEYVDVDGRKTA
jgi:hypothetical protein